MYIVEDGKRRKLTDEEIEIIAKEQARARGEVGDENAG